MRKLVAFILILTICSGYVKRIQLIETPILKSFRMSECLGECKGEKVRMRNFHNGTLSLGLDIMANCADEEIEIKKLSGDTLYLIMQPPISTSYRIDPRNGDTLRIRQGVLCDCFFNVDLTVDSLVSDPKFIRIKRYLIIGEEIKMYDKNGKLGEVPRR